ncbi:cysteinyl-tRNA synthetase [Spiromyces aspiralis]|uniref:Cysteinyl-tRNA synthetase n=1 Tax=Spiromyces aspiralis TaxID=68401 RepID=A0ACC1HV30_9FUNG|nr:cysteinyl-tRNA synthetase [Spiromyces aspiralis]
MFRRKKSRDHLKQKKHTESSSALFKIGSSNSHDSEPTHARRIGDLFGAKSSDDTSKTSLSSSSASQRARPSDSRDVSHHFHHPLSHVSNTPHEWSLPLRPPYANEHGGYNSPLHHGIPSGGGGPAPSLATIGSSNWFKRSARNLQPSTSTAAKGSNVFNPSSVQLDTDFSDLSEFVDLSQLRRPSIASSATTHDSSRGIHNGPRIGGSAEHPDLLAPPLADDGFAPTRHNYPFIPAGIPLNGSKSSLGMESLSGVAAPPAIPPPEPISPLTFGSQPRKLSTSADQQQQQPQPQQPQPQSQQQQQQQPQQQHHPLQSLYPLIANSGPPNLAPDASQTVLTTSPSIGSSHYGNGSMYISSYNNDSSKDNIYKKAGSWAPPESWAVLPPISSADVAESGLAHGAAADSDSESNGSAGSDAMDDGKLYSLRICKEDSTFGTFSCRLSTTTSEFMHMVSKRYFINDIAKYCLYMEKANGLDRMLGQNERPAAIFKHYLLQMGYRSEDGITLQGREDNSYLCRFTLSKAVIPRISPRIEESITSYENIDLRFSKLQTVPVFLYAHAAEIRILNMSKNPGLNFPTDFVQLCENLRELRLATCRLMRCPPSLQFLPQLTFLDLSGNRLKHLRQSPFSNMPHLRVLMLRNNRLRELPPSTADLTSLEVLNVSNNYFTEFPTIIVKITTLRDIDLSFNMIASIPDSISNLYLLRRLLIMANSLEGDLPNGLTKLKNLTELNVRRNRLQSLSKVASLPRLARLQSDDNRVTQVSVEIRQAQFVSLSNNKLIQFRLFNPSFTLIELDLSKNQLTELERDLFEYLPSVQRLTLDNNHLVCLPSSIACLKNLEVLSCTNNTLGSLPIELTTLKNLHSLDLHNNNLRSLPAEIWLMPQLATLNLSSNLLEQFPHPSALESSQDRAGALSSVRAMGVSVAVNRQPSNNPSKSSNESSSRDELQQQQQQQQQPRIGSQMIDAQSRRQRMSSQGSIPVSMRHSSKNRYGQYKPLDLQPAELVKSRSHISFADHTDHTSKPAAQSSSTLSTSPSSSPQGQQGQFDEGASTTLTNPKKASNSNNSATPSTGRKYTPSNPPPLSKSLRILRLAENNLDDEFFLVVQYFPNLVHLNLSYNGLFNLSPTIMTHLPALNELYLSGTQISVIPEEIPNMQYWPNLKVLHINANRLQTLPAWFTKLKHLMVLDAGSNSLKYNISNWQYDWNWNWNIELRYLNLSYNERLEIKGSHFYNRSLHDHNQQPQFHHRLLHDPRSEGMTTVNGVETSSGLSDHKPSADVSNFYRLTKLQTLSLLQLTILVPLPEETPFRRVRTTDDIRLVRYGMADTLGESRSVSAWDMVLSRFRRSEDEIVFGMFHAHDSTDQCKEVIKYLSDNFGYIFRHELEKVELDPSGTTSEEQMQNNPTASEGQQPPTGTGKGDRTTNVESSINLHHLSVSGLSTRLHESRAKAMGAKGTPGGTGPHMSRANGSHPRYASEKQVKDALRRTFLTLNKDLGTNNLGFINSSKCEKSEQAGVRLGRPNNAPLPEVTSGDHKRPRPDGGSPTGSVAPPTSLHIVGSAGPVATASAESSASKQQQQQQQQQPDKDELVKLDCTHDSSWLGKEESHTTGATAAVAFVHNRVLYVANVGDTLAVLSWRGSPVMVSTKHEPYNYNEMCRIRENGGYITENGLVQGHLDVSRAFGYFSLLPVVNSNPSIFVRHLTEEDEFLIIGNRALWNVMTPQTAIDVARKHWRGPALAAERLRDYAIAYGVTETVMVMVIEFSPLFAKSAARPSRGFSVRESVHARPIRRLTQIQQQNRRLQSRIHAGDTGYDDKRESAAEIGSSHGDGLGADVSADVSPSTREMSITSPHMYTLNNVDTDVPSELVDASIRSRRLRDREGSGPGDSTLARLGREIAPPVGEVVLVFTDVKNSTAQWDMHPVAMRSAIKIHNNVMRRTLRLIGGYEVKTEGDAFIVSFSTIAGALRWCMEVQLNLLDADWPQEILDSKNGHPIYWNPRTKMAQTFFTLPSQQQQQHQQQQQQRRAIDSGDHKQLAVASYQNSSSTTRSPRVSLSIKSNDPGSSHSLPSRDDSSGDGSWFSTPQSVSTASKGQASEGTGTSGMVGVEAPSLSLDGDAKSSLSAASPEDTSADDTPVLIYRGLRVRMGIHFGTPVCEEDPVTRRMDYFGPMVNRTARISGAADGGQIFLSQDVIDEVFAIQDLFAQMDEDGIQDVRELIKEPSLANDVKALRDLGLNYVFVDERKLRGLETPESLYMIYPDRLRCRFDIGQPFEMSGVTEPALLPSVRSVQNVEELDHHRPSLRCRTASGNSMPSHLSPPHIIEDVTTVDRERKAFEKSDVTTASTAVQSAQKQQQQQQQQQLEQQSQQQQKTLHLRRSILSNIVHTEHLEQLHEIAHRLEIVATLDEDGHYQVISDINRYLTSPIAIGASPSPLLLDTARVKGDAEYQGVVLLSAIRRIECALAALTNKERTSVKDTIYHIIQSLFAFPDSRVNNGASTSTAPQVAGKLSPIAEVDGNSDDGGSEDY